MAYCAHDEVQRLVGPQPFLEMLDDNLDGVEDSGLFDSLASDASAQVDGYLSAQYAVPFSATVPAFVRQCAKIFLAEMLYARRGIVRDANPWTRQADTLRARLERIAKGADALDAQTAGSSDSVETVTEPSRLAQHGNTMMF
ncbi:MAG TPA: DUF1320 family protein [Kiritimatiellia bacterium]|nr:DUF1320 family protein [Kiritimatiellia bacterium]